jgi:hypothetical protein
VETYAGSGEWQGVVSGGTYMGGAVTYSSTTFTDSSTTNRTTTSFRWRQSALRTTETYTGQSPGSSTYSYDDAGTLASVRILETNNTLRNRNVWLRSDAQGFYLERDERDGSITGGDPREVHYYVDGVGVGDISNNGTSDVDYVTGMSLRAASAPNDRGIQGGSRFRCRGGNHAADRLGVRQAGGRFRVTSRPLDRFRPAGDRRCEDDL